MLSAFADDDKFSRYSEWEIRETDVKGDEAGAAQGVSSWSRGHGRPWGGSSAALADASAKVGQGKGWWGETHQTQHARRWDSGGYMDPVDASSGQFEAPSDSDVSWDDRECRGASKPSNAL